jgi:putative hydrolase of the HAD superfamily
VSDDIRAVFWDFGGVILSSPFEAFNRYEAERGLPRDFIRGVNAVNPDGNAWALLERSEIGIDDFDAMFRRESTALGHAVDGRDVLALLSGDIRPAMVEALRRVTARFKTACLTNNVLSGDGPGMARSPEKAAAIAEVMTLFDAVVESSRVGVRKPQPEFYRIACDMVDIAPHEAVFLDDLGINLKPAKALGMRTIKVTDPDAALDELEDHLGIALR